jgi:hypothetical protein
MLRFIAEPTLQQEISMFRYCYECVNKATGARHCLVCGSEEETHLLLCNSCPRAYHTSCLTPPLAKVTLINSVAESSAFLTPGSGMGKKSGSRMNNPDRVSESLEIIFWVKKLKFSDPLHC